MTSKRSRQVRFWVICGLSMVLFVGLVFLVESILLNKEDTGSPEVEIGTLNEAAVDEKVESFDEYYGRADKILTEMTLEEKVGQIFLARMPEDGVEDEIQRYQPGGYILFGVNFRNETPDSLRRKIGTYQALSKTGLILGVDEEGGSVVRVSLYPAFRTESFPAPRELFAEGGMVAILRDSAEKSQLLKELGINMNLTPVADVPTSEESFIYGRSLGRSADETAGYVAQVVERMNRDDMISVMKHFPGYGDNLDTHTGVAVDNREYEEFLDYDFLPFLTGIRVGGPAILVSHNVVTAMDDIPASLSPRVHQILRDELDFTGVIMTDDLAMGAVREYAENGDAATKAVLAGNDMIITSSLSKDYDSILSAVKRGEISEEKLNTAVRRVLAMKLKYGVI